MGVDSVCAVDVVVVAPVDTGPVDVDETATEGFEAARPAKVEVLVPQDIIMQETTRKPPVK